MDGLEAGFVDHYYWEEFDPHWKPYTCSLVPDLSLVNKYLLTTGPRQIIHLSCSSLLPLVVVVVITFSFNTSLTKHLLEFSVTLKKKFFLPLCVYNFQSVNPTLPNP